jgi:hypothetical protein
LLVWILIIGGIAQGIDAFMAGARAPGCRPCAVHRLALIMLALAARAWREASVAT